MAKEKDKPGEKLIVRNKRATFDYELGERFEAGLVLMGSEVKMLRRGSADLTDAWCSIKQGQAYLEGVNIPEMSGTAFGHEAKRSRKLLLHGREIEEIQRAIQREGMTITAVRLYFKEGKVKAEIALARGKKSADKRDAMREKDAEREARAAMARARRAR